MKKKTLLLSTLAGSMLVAGMAFPSVNASSNNIVVNEEQNIVVVQLTDGSSQLSKVEFENMVKDKYSAKGLSISPVLSGDTVATGSKVKIDNDKTLDVVVYGDINGDGLVDISDAQIITQRFLDGPEFNRLESIAGGIAGSDSSIDISDAQRLTDFMLNPEDYADSGFIDNTVLPEEVIEPTQVVSVKNVKISTTSSNEVIEVVLSSEVKEPRFYLNGVLLADAKISNSGTDKNVYTITLDSKTLKENEENTLRITNEQATFDQTEKFIYRKMIAPTEAYVAAESGNKKNEVNASNVNNAKVEVLFEEGNENLLPISLEIKITGKDFDGEEKNYTTSKTLKTKETVIAFDNIDLSGFAEGSLSITASVLDSEGNYAVSDASDIEKFADAPIIKYTTASRTNQKEFSISGLSSTNADDTFYYLVKESEANAPSVDEVLNGNSSTGSALSSINYDEGIADKAYVVYLVAKTKTGTVSTSVLPIKIAKTTASKIDTVTDLKLVTGTEATYSWKYDEEKNNGLIEYKIVLKNSVI